MKKRRAESVRAFDWARDGAPEGKNCAEKKLAGRIAYAAFAVCVCVVFLVLCEITVLGIVA